MGKIYLRPGMVASQYDGQTHYVGLMQLYSMYKLTARDAEPWAPWIKLKKEDIVLRPSYECDYNLPEKARQILEARNGNG